MFDKKQFPLGSISANEKSSTNTIDLIIIIIKSLTNTQIHLRKPLCRISYM